MRRIAGVFGWLPLASLVVLQTGISHERALTAQEPSAITVRMEDCNVTRKGKLTKEVTIVQILAGTPKEILVKRGFLDVDGHKYILYLPKAKSYSIKNTSPKNHDLENTSTLISVDQKGDGKFQDWDGWLANMPIRLGDKMFDVTEIADDGSRIVLEPSKAVLRGVIVGRACPPFSFKTVEGKEVSLKSLAGKPFILDVWSIT